ncbi:MAG: BON domain-containing protein [Pirellulales bacterium]|nr:BON domain-containing protein [Pirellulales bacterium]
MSSYQHLKPNSPRFSSEVVKSAKDHLKKNPYPDIRNVSCNCDRGVLVLRGNVSSYHHKQVAQEAVFGLDGVTRILNEIEVRGSGDQRSST